MLILVSGATTTLRSFGDDRFGVLIEPQAKCRPATLQLQPGKWAMDNGAYAGLDVAAYLQMLERYRAMPGCLWVTAPDVVGDAAATLARWPFWSRLLRGLGYAPALERSTIRRWNYTARIAAAGFGKTSGTASRTAKCGTSRRAKHTRTSPRSKRSTPMYDPLCDDLARTHRSCPARCA
jgi:hypothetical protein